jgi:iron complex transport system substrate-binding protein
VTRKHLILSLAAPVVLAFALACGGGSDEPAPTPQPQAQFPVSLRTSDNQTLTIAQKPQRIVSLSAHATEIFCATGAESQLVAVDRYANCPAGTKSKPELDGFRPNLEAIAGMRPDLVYVSSNSGGIVEGLRGLNIPVLYLEVPKNLNGVLEHIRTLAGAAGHAAEAKTLTDQMNTKMNAVKDKLASTTQGPRVFHELTTDYYSAAPASFVGDFYTFLKAQNIATGATTEYPQLSAEVIIQRNPQVIVLADEAAGVTAAMVKARPGWTATDAVKNDRICVVDPDVVSRPGPRIVDALDTLAKCVYPERFS